MIKPRKSLTGTDWISQKIKEEQSLGKVSKIKIKKLVEFSTKGGGGGSGWVDFPLRKKNKKKCKDDKNGPFHPENWRLTFFIIGGVRSNFRADGI